MSATITAPDFFTSTAPRSAELRRASLAADVRATRERNGFGTKPVRTRLHLTRRGRVVLTLLAAVAIVVGLGAAMLNGGGADATSSTGHVHFQHVTIQPDETLWQVAEQVAPNSDPRDVINDIVKLNDLQTTSVMAGQSIAIPTQYSSH
ncbi:LysM peptidoglycan-binding domain-containing protein [Frondihabitans australicus]|uniref:LysM domain-containing protein n=1 Tax=Frondihabitans australicus TaxID=386892 RepID=A0A495IGE7_9MICO|nr:LysM peptidoglycan-binding domain-containing protein [Frondihabitans australicus]RKR74478.1 LysM domain-containing protein [Frondihabitans australicus]